MCFRERVDAGRELATRLAEHPGRADVLLQALPRGGVPVAAEVSKTLRALLDVFLVRKAGCAGTLRARERRRQKVDDLLLVFDHHESCLWRRVR